MSEDVKRQIVNRARELGKSLKELSEAIGRNHAYLQQFVNYDTPKELGETDRIALARELGLNEELLKPAHLRKNDSLAFAAQDGQPGDTKETAVRKLMEVVRTLVAVHGEPVVREAFIRVLTVEPAEVRPTIGQKTF